jgi:hypothetical protein
MKHNTLTPEEMKVVRSAVRASLDLRVRYAKLTTEDAKMKRKQLRFQKIEIPILKSALGKLKE